VNGRSSSGIELLVGQRVSTPPRYNLKASRISIGTGTVVGGDVFYNQLSNAGSIAGASHTPLSLPVVAAVPSFQNATVGTADVSVPTGTLATLSSGNYRNLVVQPGATLTMQGGTYNFYSISIKSGAKMFFAAASTVRVKDVASADIDTAIEPADGSGVKASSIVFYIAGKDAANNPSSKAVVLGPGAKIAANIFVPNGTLWMKNNTVAQGAFIGKEQIIGKNVKVTLASAFTGLTKQDESSGEELPLPESFAVEQNYPNPFNPVTTIKYTLAANSDVSLIVYDLLGREVAVLVNDRRPAGRYQVTFDGASLASGVYFYRLKAGEFISTKKMIFMK
jgi:hypothetical protein